jgi:hypothetical protein
MTAAEKICGAPWRLLALPAAGGLGLVVMGYFPTSSIAGRTGLGAMLAAQAVVVALVYATVVPALRRMVGADVKRRFRIALQAGVIRFLATVLVAAAVGWYAKLNTDVFLVWLAIAYVVMIKIETWVLIHWSKRLEGGT